MASKTVILKVYREQFDIDYYRKIYYALLYRSIETVHN